MKESFWGYLILLFGIFIIVIMMIIRDYQTTNDEDYFIMKEVTQAAMIDSIDYAYYREHNDLRIIEEKFAENFLRRFAESMSSNKTYKIELFDLNENPPKVSVRITTSTGEYIVEQEQGAVDFGVVNILSAILDMKHENVVYNNDYIEGDSDGDGRYDLNIERTYYSVSWITSGTRQKNYQIKVWPIPEGVDLNRVVSTRVQIEPMSSYNDFDKYVQEKNFGNMTQIGGYGTGGNQSVANITPSHLRDHALTRNNFTVGATGSCNIEACYVDINATINNFDGVIPTGGVEMEDGTIRNGLYYVPVKFRFTFTMSPE